MYVYLKIKKEYGKMYHSIYQLLTTITHIYVRTVIPLGGITIKAPVQESSFIQPKNLSTSLKYDCPSWNRFCVCWDGFLNQDMAEEFT